MEIQDVSSTAMRTHVDAATRQHRSGRTAHGGAVVAGILLAGLVAIAYPVGVAVGLLVGVAGTTGARKLRRRATARVSWPGGGTLRARWLGRSTSTE